MMITTALKIANISKREVAEYIVKDAQGIMARYSPKTLSWSITREFRGLGISSVHVDQLQTVVITVNNA